MSASVMTADRMVVRQGFLLILITLLGGIAAPYMVNMRMGVGAAEQAVQSAVCDLLERELRIAVRIERQHARDQQLAAVGCCAVRRSGRTSTFASRLAEARPWASTAASFGPAASRSPWFRPERTAWSVGSASEAATRPFLVPEA